MFNRYGRFPQLPFWAKVGEIPTSYKVAMSYEEQLLWLCHEIENIKNSSGNYNYELLNNKPSINGYELIGNKSLNSLGIQEKLQAGTGITINGNVISATGGGSGGTDDYRALDNKPQINGVTLIGNKSFSDLGLNFPTKTVWHEPSDYDNVDVDTYLLFDLTNTNIGESIPNWETASNTKVYCMKASSIPSLSFKVSGRCSNVMWAIVDGYPYFSIGDKTLIDKSEVNLQYTDNIIELTYSTLPDTSNYYILFQFTDTAFDTPIFKVASQEVDFGTDYNNLDNKPTINGVTLIGDLTSQDLHIDGGTGVINLTSNYTVGNSLVDLDTGFYNTSDYNVYINSSSNVFLGRDNIFYFDKDKQIFYTPYEILFGQLEGGVITWYRTQNEYIENELTNSRNKIPTSQAVYNAIQNFSGLFYTELNENITLNADGTITPALTEGYYFLKSPRSITYYDNETSSTTFIFTNGIFFYDGENTIYRTGVNARLTNQIETKLRYSSGTNSWELSELDDSNFVQNLTGTPSFLNSQIPDTRKR